MGKPLSSKLKEVLLRSVVSEYAKHRLILHSRAVMFRKQQKRRISYRPNAVLSTRRDPCSSLKVKGILVRVSCVQTASSSYQLQGMCRQPAPCKQNIKHLISEEEGKEEHLEFDIF